VAMACLAALLLKGGCTPRPTAERQPDAAGSRVPAQVTHVADGDTIAVSLGGREEEVRMIGVDTPETVDPDEPVQCFGPQASDFTHRLLDEAPVELGFDAERRDVYGRLLAYVYLPGAGPDGQALFVNAELARRGLARTLTIPPNDSHAPFFARLAARAGVRGRGLWGRCPL